MIKKDNFKFLVEVTIIIAFIPALAGYYLNSQGRWVWSLVCYLLSVWILSLPFLFWFTVQSIQFILPHLLKTLGFLNRRLTPIVQSIANNPILGPIISIGLKSQFFIWFMVLMSCDQFIRIVLGRLAGQHASNQYLSLINVVDPKFFKPLEDSKQTMTNLTENYGKSNANFKRPQYSIGMAHTLAIASKLCYEDVTVVQYELEKAGYDMNTFKAIGYKNTCAYIAEKDNNVILAFRGTNPLNIQNYVTNLDAGLTRVEFRNGNSGKVHKGFWDAMGTTENKPEPTSLVEIGSLSIKSAVWAVVRIVKGISFKLFANVIDPIDASWVGYDPIVRHQSLYTQAEIAILRLFERAGRKRLYVTGHSLGGALATVFVAKMIQKESELLNNFEGLYTYGQPNIGDRDFGKSFGLDITCKIFNHTYNNDVIPRIPFWYSPPPGTLVYIDSAYKISIYPPNQITNDPIPVRNISFLHLSGLLNTSVIWRARSETSVRVLFRLLFPFFINDHFPSDYADALLNGNVEWVILGEEEGGHEDEKSTKRYSLTIANEEEM